jgi:FG-GAP-like repeat/Transposase, Mutator family
VQARLEDEAQCLLVIIGATPEGKKELVGLIDGVRESAQSWRELLLDLKRRGLAIAPELAVADGALGFWQAIEEVWPKTSQANAVNADGSVIVGATAGYSGQAFIWTASSGMQPLQAMLTRSGVNLDGWQLLSADGISSDGTVIVGTGLDPNGNQHAWVAVLPPGSVHRVVSHDFNGDGKSDIAWRNLNGDTATWLLSITPPSRAEIILAASDYGIVPGSWQIVGQRDFNADGKVDLLWSNTNGDTSIWLMNGTMVSATPDLGIVGNGWSIVGTGDFNGDGFGDILWRNTNGDTSIWLMTGTSTQVQVLSATDLGFVPQSWSIAGIGDFNGDGSADILWHNTNGDTSIWFMTPQETLVQVLSVTDIGLIPQSWSIVGTGDFNGDGVSDILWHNSNGDTSIWLMNGNGIQVSVLSATDLGFVPQSWSVAQTGDFNGDGNADILWRNDNGDTSIWFMNGGVVSSVSSLGVHSGGGS